MRVAGLLQRWRWLVAAGVLLVTALWFAARPGDDARPGAVIRVATPAPQADEAVALPPAVVSVKAASHGEERPHGADETEVCGLGWVKAQADGTVDSIELEQATRATEARARIVATLRADTSELSQATALWLAMLGDGADTAQAREALAQRAVSSTDPRAYALAFNICRSNQRNDGACQMLSASQWARLDPGNAIPWLTLLSEAKNRKDRAAEDEALHRIATAQRSELGFFAVPGLVVNAASADDASVLAAWAMATEMFGYESAWSLPSYQHVAVACKGTELRDANRRQTCAAIADVLTERSDTFIDRTIGAAIGKQLGWPAERNDQIRGELNAYTESLSPPSAGRQSLACADMRRDLEGLRRNAALGETGALREWVAQSGKKPEAFVREERARQKLALEYSRAFAASAAASAAAEAASAASAASP